MGFTNSLFLHKMKISKKGDAIAEMILSCTFSNKSLYSNIRNDEVLIKMFKVSFVHYRLVRRRQASTKYGYHVLLLRPRVIPKYTILRFSTISILKIILLRARGLRINSTFLRPDDLLAASASTVD